MHIDIVPNRGGTPTVLLRKSYREHGKTRKQTVANLSELAPEQIEQMRATRRGAGTQARGLAGGYGAELKCIEARVQREKNPLRGGAAIGQAIGAVLGKYQVGKHFQIEIGEAGFSFN